MYDVEATCSLMVAHAVLLTSRRSRYITVLAYEIAYSFGS